MATLNGHARCKNPPILDFRANCCAGFCDEFPNDLRAGQTSTDLFGDGAPETGTRDRLIHRALDLFYEHGFHAVGLDRIIDEARVSKQTFYNHFASKDDLIVDAIKVRDEWESRAFREGIEKMAGDDPRRRLLAAFDVLDQWFAHPDFKGCLFLNACSEYPNPHDPIHQAAAEHQRAGRGWYESLAREAGLADPANLANAWVLLMQGAITQRQVMRDDQAARNAKVIAQKLLDCSE